MRFKRLLLWFASLSAVTIDGYVPSKHPAAKRVNIEEISRTVQGSSNARIRLEPVFKRNPLEKHKQLQQQVPKKSSPAPQSTDADQLRRQGDDRRQAFFVSAIAALTGFSDILCLANYRCFVNMITGNLLKLTSAVANFQVREALFNGIVVFSYLSGVAIFSQIKNRFEGEEEALRFVAPIVASFFIGADILAWYLGCAKAVQVCLLASGFAVINTAAASASQQTIYFAMTGHLTKITNSLATGSAFDATTKKSANIVLFFGCGALLAGLLLARGSMGRGVTGMVPTLLGVLYGALFSWYAPIMPLLRQKMGGDKGSLSLLRHGWCWLKPTSGRIGRVQEPAILVDVFRQDLLFASNGTIIANSAY